MRVRLLDPERDVDIDAEEPVTADDLRRDLELDHLWDAMGAGDRILRAVSRAVMLQPVTDPDVVVYRQRALADVNTHRADVEQLYAVATGALGLRRGILSMPVRGRPELTLSQSVRMLMDISEYLGQVRETAARIAEGFSSPAFRGMFDDIAQQLDDDYLTVLKGQLKELTFPTGLLMSAGIGPDGQVSGPVLRRGRRENRGLFDRTPLKRPMFTFTLPERDEAGAEALERLRARAVTDVATAAQQSLDHVTAFFRRLRDELAFYLAADNLRTALQGLGVPLCTPTVAVHARCTTTGLCDPCLALGTQSAPVGNDLDLPEEGLLVITGANQGGKSTFLRALGVAQLMAQSGLFVAAEQFGCHSAGRVLTHWTREEDEELRHGKLDDELARMSDLVDVAAAGDVLLCNESFASTNEAEGSQIAWEVASALTASGVRMRYVTHMYDFAQQVGRSDIDVTYLRAPRDAAGGRSHRLEEGPPLSTSFGVDLYDEEFGTDLAGAAEEGKGHD